MSILLIIILLVTILIGLPIYLSLGAVSIYYFATTDVSFSVMAQSARQGADNFLLVAIPLFVLSGNLMNSGGITKRLIAFSNALVGHFKGGLAQINVLVSMLFAGMSGSSLSDTAALGAVLIPSMKEEGYDADFSAAVTCSSAIVGPIIPPSIPMVIAASLAGISVGGLFLAAAIPGLLIGLLLMVVVYIISKKKNYPSHEKTSFRGILKAGRDSFFALLTPVIIVGGILSGVFTATEAAGIAVIYALVVAVFVYKELTWNSFFQECVKTAKFTGQIMLLVAFINTYTYILTRTRFPSILYDFLLSISPNEYVIMIMVIIFCLLVGMFISGNAAVMLAIPMLSLLPAQLGFSNFHFYAVVAIALCFGNLTPPVGLNLYLATSIAKIPIQDTLRAMMPFYLVLFLSLLIILFIPQLTTWLPSLM